MKKTLTFLALALVIYGCSTDGPDVDPVCLKPSGLEANNITNTTATLNWQSAVSTSVYELEYGPVGFVPGDGVMVSPTQSSYNASDLTPSTDYEFYVNLYCPDMDTFSDLSGPLEFTTLDSNPFCEDPTNFMVRNNNQAIGSDYVNFKWDGAGNNGFEIEYGPEDFAHGTGTIHTEGENGWGIVTGLSANTTYDFYVRNNCEPNGNSNWSNLVTATTL